MNTKRISAPVAATVFAFTLTFAFAITAHAQDVTPPVTPSGVYASLTQSNQVYISWPSTTDDTGVVGYYLYRNGAFLTSTPGYTFYTDNASPGTYYYSVSAYDAAGNVSQLSPASSPVTVLADTQPPTTPTNLTATNTSSTATLSWDTSTDDIAVVGYYVYRNGVRLSNTNGPITSGSYIDTGLSLGSSYTYSVVAYDAAGNTSPRSNTVTVSIVFDVTPPSVPQNVVVKPVSSSEDDLSWRASTDNIAVAGYNIFQNGNLIATTASTTYADTGLSPSTVYSYNVSAYDPTGNTSAQTYTITVTTLGPDITPPSIPTQLSAVALGPDTVNLTWHASTDDVGVAGYYIYRDGDQIGNSISPSYQDTGLTTSTTYTYAVKAYDAAGNISPQNSVAVTTLAYVPTTPIVVTPTPSPTPTPSSLPTPTALTTPSTNGFVFTTALYFGLQNATVKMLQTNLIAQGYLGPNYATGYFGGLTQAAVQKFQCAKAIVCSGGPSSTGYGFVGVRTRAALNALSQ